MRITKFIIGIASLSILLLSSCSGPKETTGSEADHLKEVKPQTSTFKILTINTAHRLQDNGDAKKIADWIKSTGAEVVAVQEIERATESKPGFDAVSELAKRLDMRYQFGKARYYKGWDSGNALFSLYPIQQTNVYPLPVGKGKVRRSMAYGVIDLGLKQLAFGSTELDDASLSERIRQAGEICSITESVKSYPMIVAGNFGEEATGKTAEKMAQKYIAANTVNDDAKSLDQHVYVPASDKFKILSVEKVKYAGMAVPGILATIEILQ